MVDLDDGENALSAQLLPLANHGLKQWRPKKRVQGQLSGVKV